MCFSVLSVNGREEVHLVIHDFASPLLQLQISESSLRSFSVLANEVVKLTKAQNLACLEIHTANEVLVGEGEVRPALNRVSFKFGVFCPRRLLSVLLIHRDHLNFFPLPS